MTIEWFAIVVPEKADQLDSQPDKQLDLDQYPDTSNIDSPMLSRILMLFTLTANQLALCQAGDELARNN